MLANASVGLWASWSAGCTLSGVGSSSNDIEQSASVVASSEAACSASEARLVDRIRSRNWAIDVHCDLMRGNDLIIFIWAGSLLVVRLECRTRASKYNMMACRHCPVSKALQT